MTNETGKTEETQEQKKQPEKRPPARAARKESAELFDVKDLAEKYGLPDWEFHALMRAAAWALGKMVVEAVFAATLEKFRSRPQGGGRI